jgi:N-hydroxyarylamine O-acetyltransferase
MPDTIDIDAYFRRIGYSGSRAPTLDTLRGIHLHHAQTVPYENLDPLLRRPVNLDLPSLERKLVREGRGGYCFEQNLLLAEVLRTLGFELTCLAARVTWNAPEGALRPRTHMLIAVNFKDGPYVADVGFGGFTLTAPLRLAADIEQETPHELFRLVNADGRFVMQALLRDAWKSLYHFDLQAQLLPDYEVANWYVSTHPQSHFTFVLMAALTAPGRRYALANNQLSIHRIGAPSQQRILSSAPELRGVLADTFRIVLPEDEGLDPLLARIAAIPSSGTGTS